MELKINKVDKRVFQIVDPSGRILYTTTKEKHRLASSITTIFRGDGVKRDIIAVVEGKRVTLDGKTIKQDDIVFKDSGRWYDEKRKFRVNGIVYKFKVTPWSCDQNLYITNDHQSPHPLATFSSKVGFQVLFSSPERGSIVISHFGMDHLLLDGNPTLLLDQALIVNLLVQADEKLNQAVVAGAVA